MQSTATAEFEPRSIVLTKNQIKQFIQKLVNAALFPALGIGLFLLLWQFTATNIVTSLGQFPGPSEVWTQSKGVMAEHYAEREKEQAFYDRQEKRNAKKLEKNPDAVVKIRNYTGKATFVDQIFTSLYTVGFGFLSPLLSPYR